ncbi:MAG TPA: FtsX-like permease family protein [Nocardioidaceae bacterium]|nr:FtsX-like permease family protein [Nocardioidaceae bacterium]
MRGAIALGLRLTGAGAGPARLRTALMLLATCVGTVLMLVIAAIASAEQTMHQTMYADSAQLRRLLYAVVLTVSLPILALVATAGRLSAELRERRLANLRLLGLSPSQTRAVAVTEAAISALAGVLLGALLFQPIRWALAALHPAGQHWPYAALTPTPPWYAVICLAVLLAVIAIAVLPQRTQMSSALARARRADLRRPSWLRVLPLLAGAVTCVQELIRSGHRTTDVYWVLFVGVPLLGIGLLLVVPVLVRLLADAMLRSDRTGPVAMVAARRMQAQPAGVSRVVSGLLIGLFVVTGARGVVGAFENGTQEAVRQLTEQQRVEVAATLHSETAVTARALRVRGVRQVIAFPTLTTPCGRFGCETAIVATCAQLHAIAPALHGCVDNTPMWLEHSGKTKSTTLHWRAITVGTPSKAVAAATRVPARQVAGNPWTELSPLDASVLLPPSIVDPTKLPTDTHVDVLVLGAPGRTLADHLAGAGLSVESTADFGFYDYVAELRAIVWAVAAVLLSVGLLAFAVAAIDRAVNRRREVVSLQILGVPASLLRRAQWVEAALPIGVGTLLAVGAGLLASAAYLTYGSAVNWIPWHASGILTLISLAGATAIAGLTVIAASPRIRPELIRAE